MNSEAETKVVIACEVEWGRALARYSDKGRMVQHSKGEVLLRNPDLRLIRILHPDMLRGRRFTSWAFWCRHHLSGKQIARLEETLPAVCSHTDPFEGGRNAEQETRQQVDDAVEQG